MTNKKELEFIDFEHIALSAAWVFRDDKYELCLEPCLNGFDVAIYKRSNLNLVIPKRCTNIKGNTYESYMFDITYNLKHMKPGDIKKVIGWRVKEVEKALEIANIFYKRFMYHETKEN